MAKFREGNLYIKDDKLLIGTASWALNAQAGEGNFSGSFSGSFFGDLIGDVIANDIYISESLIVTDITASGDIVIDGLIDGVDISVFSESVNVRLTNEEITSSALINDYTYVQSVGTNNAVEFNSVSASNGLYVSESLVVDGYLAVSSSDDSYFMNSNIGIGTETPSVELEVFGEISSSGNIYTDSDLIVTNITASGDIYASGEISSSGNIYTEADLIVTDITSSGDIIINGQIYAANIGSAESNIVFVSSSNGQFKTDEINPIVWDTDATFISSSDGLDNRVAVYTSPSGIEGDAKFTWNGSTLSILGKLEATQKSFVIKNPSKTEGKLEYGSLESPYHGIRLTGEDTTNKLGYCEINLPYYVKDLVNTDQINIQLTNINNFKIFTVSEINIDDNKFIIKVKRNLIDLLFRRTFKFYWDLTAERKDIEKLKVEI